jgi:uncharacterized damage-inducible protein DinB
MNAKARYYLLHGLEAAPAVLEHLLKDCPESAFDVRPDPERFTLREMVAHLADWEGVWLGRAHAFVEEDKPSLPGYDEGQWAIDHDYANASMQEQLAKFRDGRKEMVSYLRALSAEAWDREAVHGEWGEAKLADMVALVAGHDGYHLGQTAHWIEYATT